MILTASSCVIRARENHQPHRQRIGKKGFASWRWIVGGKLCILANKFGLVTDWSVKTANVSETEFLPLVESVRHKMIVLADRGFRRRAKQPENLKICTRGEWNDRMLIETLFSLLSQVCKLKHLRQRVWAYFEMRLAYTVALFNLLQQKHQFVNQKSEIRRQDKKTGNLWRFSPIILLGNI